LGALGFEPKTLRLKVRCSTIGAIHPLDKVGFEPTVLLIL
jgi:hypothetical protein